MGIKNVVAKIGNSAGNKVAKLSALSSGQVEEVQLKREEYLLEKPNPNDELAIDTTWRMMAASSVEIFNAYLPKSRNCTFLFRKLPSILKSSTLTIIYATST